jgi:hypothetical protein
MPSAGRDPSQNPVAFTAPVPRPLHHLLGAEATAGRRSRATLGSWPVLSRFCSVSPTHESSFRSTRSSTLSCPRSRRPRPPFTRPWRSFWGSVCRAYLGPDVALPTSATCLRRAGNQTATLGSSLGRRPRPSSGSDASRPLPCGSGDTRRAALRPFASTPVPVPPTCVGLPDRDVDSNAPPSPTCAGEVQWRSTCTGPWTE